MLKFSAPLFESREFWRLTRSASGSFSVLCDCGDGYIDRLTYHPFAPRLDFVATFREDSK
jgi:hypothetical protein